MTGKPGRKTRASSEKTKTALCDLKHLKSLTLDYCMLTSECFGSLKNKSLHSLSVEGCDKLNELGILYIVINCSNIQDLNINYCPKLKDSSINTICFGLLKLRRLKMNEIPGVTENVFEKIAANTKSLRYLHMKDYDHIKNRQELAQGLFRKISSLRVVKLGVRQEVHRNDVV